MKESDACVPDSPRSGAVLHMVCGKIASGKSTLAQQLARESDAVILSEDGWLTRLYPDKIHSLADYVRFSGRVKEALSDHVRTLLAMGISVVLDFPFNTITSRAWGNALLSGSHARHQLHYLDVSDEVCKTRLRTRNTAGEHPFQTTDSQFDEITRYFVPPTPNEGFTVVVHVSN